LRVDIITPGAYRCNPIKAANFAASLPSLWGNPLEKLEIFTQSPASFMRFFGDRGNGELKNVPGALYFAPVFHAAGRTAA
jgi:hypothetical protein